MAIARNTTSETSVGAGTAASSHSHTTTGSNMVMYIQVTTSDSNTISDANVTYNGVAATLVEQEKYSDGNYSPWLFRLVNPATGSNTVSVTRTGTTASMFVKVATYSGVAQTSTSDDIDKARSTGTVTTLSITTTPTVSNDWAIYVAVDADGGTVTAGTGLATFGGVANLWNRILDTNGTIAIGANSLTANKTSGASGFMGVVESFKVVASTPLLTLLGVGT